MSTDGFFVEVFQRPRRVAFLVDIEQASDPLFDEIVDFNICWTGCGNFLPRGSQFRVQIADQATIVPILRPIPEALPAIARVPEPAVLDFKEGDTRRLSSFLRRNFGGSVQFHIWCRDQKIPTVEVPPDDRDVMAVLAANRNLLIPVQMSGDMPRNLRASTKEIGTALTLYYGASPWNFADYWNSVHYSDVAHGMHRSLSEMWLPPTVLEDKFFYEALQELG